VSPNLQKDGNDEKSWKWKDSGAVSSKSTNEEDENADVTMIETKKKSLNIFGGCEPIFPST
jgi:hypothetical protein